ncbi:polyisoprenoid-binding protein YceI [Rhodopseudomonas rhenobacensis]|uniref:Polyisoprenoid-binding protein YceI n=1 Tax=Rhodopseudomonas rhenobacensis TaxID=87461 RepID=A0A7W7Z1S3_9BRAD|nr:YceI family protein [Rhodopseudomonas rhenobacensis]MBB5046450.1 polyisoprenoid-binding protein YceI [Rhodopseudomonas rhenobacensis]
MIGFFAKAARILAVATLGVVVSNAAEASSWKVDPARSQIGFSGTQTGERFQGKFGRYQATIDFDPAAPEGGHAVIAIELGSATTGDKQRDQALPGEDWFDVSRFPTATFEAKRFVAKGGNAYEAQGTLSLRGVSRDLVLPFTLDTKDGVAHAKGHVDLLRNAYGVGQNAWSSDAYVAFAVGVDIDLIATAAP